MFSPAFLKTIYTIFYAIYIIFFYAFIVFRTVVICAFIYGVVFVTISIYAWSRVDIGDEPDGLIWDIHGEALIRRKRKAKTS